MYMCRIGREGKSLLIDRHHDIGRAPGHIPGVEALLGRWLYRLFRGVLDANEAGRSAAAGGRSAWHSLVEATRLPCVTGMHHMVLGLSQQEMIQDTRRGCSGLRGSGCREAARTDTEGSKGLAQSQRQGADYV